MLEKLIDIIMIIIVILILSVVAVFGVIFVQETGILDAAIEPENFETVVSEIKDTIENTIETPKIVETDNPFARIKDPVNEKTTTIDYSNVNIDRYFYNQLEDYSKIIYKAFEANRESMKTGTQKIEFGDTFSNVLNSGGSQELQKYYQSAIEAYTYDNPSIFYLSPNKMYLNIETTTRGNKKTYNVYIDNGKQNNYLIDEFSSKEQIDFAINQIEQIKNDIISRRTGNTYSNIKMVHDYLVDNIEYDSSVSAQNIYNVYGALVNRICVCEGYARSFKYIMDELNIPCVLVIGQGTNSQGQTENHAWNYVQISGIWYAIDNTWDDPVIIGNGFLSRENKYRYFLKGSSTFNQNHIANGQFTRGRKSI